MKIPLTFLLFTLAVAASAQTAPATATGIDAGTFGMTKATLEFLATDQKTFGVVKKTTCESCRTYGDLANFIKANNLKKADGLVNDIKKHSLLLNDGFAADAFTSEEDMLDSLRRYVMKRVTIGAERVHRTKLASFPTYRTQMIALAGGIAPDQAAEQIDLADGETSDETATTAFGGNWTGAWMGTWAFWLSLLNLLGLGYLLLTRKRRTSYRKDARTDGSQHENNRLSTTVAELVNRLTVLERKQANSASANPANRLVERGPVAAQPTADRDIIDRGPMSAQAEAPRRNDVPTEHNPVPSGQMGNQPRAGYGNPANPVIPPQNVPSDGVPSGGVASGGVPSGNTQSGGVQQAGSPLANPVSPLSSQSQDSGLRTTPVIPPAPGTLSNSPERPAMAGGSNPNPALNIPPAPAAAPTKLFARTADLGNGFSKAGLLAMAERGTVYEIDLTSPNTATYRVSQSPESQQLAMSDPYSYLSDACLYENQPGGPSSRIQTVAPGQLVLQGDKWQITEKARIGFN